MENKLGEQMEAYSKAAINSGKELEALNTRLIDGLTQKQMELVNSLMDSGNQFVSMMGDAKSYPVLWSEQVKFFRDYNEKLLAATKDAVQIVADSRGEYQAWMQKGVETLTTATIDLVPAPQAVKKAA